MPPSSCAWPLPCACWWQVIGKTFPVTYQVLGHLKTCLVLAFGYLVLENPFSYKNMAGILVRTRTRHSNLH